MRSFTAFAFLCAFSPARARGPECARASIPTGSYFGCMEEMVCLELQVLSESKLSFAMFLQMMTEVGNGLVLKPSFFALPEVPFVFHRLNCSMSFDTSLSLTGGYMYEFRENKVQLLDSATELVALVKAQLPDELKSLISDKFEGMYREGVIEVMNVQLKFNAEPPNWAELVDEKIKAANSLLPSGGPASWELGDKGKQFLSQKLTQVYLDLKTGNGVEGMGAGLLVAALVVMGTLL